MSTFDCPRCGAEVSAEFYAPCESCFETLRASQRTEPRLVEGASKEYKMNVTPNAVALPSEN